MKFKCTFFLIFLLIFAGCSDKKEIHTEKNTVKIETKKPKPKKKPIIYPIKLKTLKDVEIDVVKINKGFSFSNVDNKAVLLNFFTTWCPPCKAEIPHLNNLQKEYKDKLEIIGVLLEDKNMDEIDGFVKDYNVKFTIVYGKSNFTLARALGDVKAIPFSILYDKNGTYATHYVGAIPEEMMDVDIKKVVK